MKNAWYTSHVDTGTAFTHGDCSKNIVTNLIKGLCHGGSKDDMRNCTSFSDTSYFQDLDDLFAQSYQLDTDMTHGAELFQYAHNLILTILSFACITIACSVFAEIILPKEYHVHLQVFLSALTCLSLGFTVLIMFLGNANNDLLNYDAWMIIYCYDQYITHESFDNKKIADFAYVCCILLIGLEIGALSFFLTPGNCCFCMNCTCFSCCKCMQLDEEERKALVVKRNAIATAEGYVYAPVHGYEPPTAPLLNEEHEYANTQSQGTQLPSQVFIYDQGKNPV